MAFLFTAIGLIALVLKERFNSDVYLFLFFGIWVALGFYANRLWGWHLHRKGYIKAAKIGAPSQQEAIRQFIESDDG